MPLLALHEWSSRELDRLLHQRGFSGPQLKEALLRDAELSDLLDQIRAERFSRKDARAAARRDTGKPVRSKGRP
jgi:hypothetical protein